MAERIGDQRGPCPRCGTPLPLFRFPGSLREAVAGGWTCSGCGADMDRVGRPLDEYPSPGPYWYWTQTRGGAIGQLLAGLLHLFLSAVFIWLPLTESGQVQWWRWIPPAFLILLGVTTVITSAMSIYAHHRWPWPEQVRDQARPG